MWRCILVVLLIVSCSVGGDQNVTITDIRRVRVSDSGSLRRSGVEKIVLEIDTNALGTITTPPLYKKIPVLSIETQRENNVVESNTYASVDGSNMFVDGANVQIGSIHLNSTNELLEFEIDALSQTQSAAIVNASSIGMPPNSCGVKDHNHTDDLNIERRSLEYDKWYGSDACFPGDDDLHVIDIGMAIGHFAYIRWGNLCRALLIS